MYDSLLDTFIAAADCGNFTKAAQHLYMSSTAVMKQMNALEHRLDLILIARKRGGNFIFAESLEEGGLMTVGNRGFMPIGVPLCQPYRQTTAPVPRG